MLKAFFEGEKGVLLYRDLESLTEIHIDRDTATQNNKGKNQYVHVVSVL